MSEKEKMLTGQLYYPADMELSAERDRAKQVCQQLNQVCMSRLEERQEILRGFLGRLSGAFEILSPFQCDYGYNIEIGHNFFANYNLIILDCAAVTFGDNVFIAPNCGFYTATHPIDANQRRTGVEYAQPIVVGNDVWIGAGVHVMPGVTIGSNVVIGAGSVVVKDIPDNVVAVGNPCRVIKQLPPVTPLV